MRWRSSVEIPIPVSITSTDALSSAWLTLTCTIPPDGVYFIALLTRLINIRLTAPLSTRVTSGSGSTSSRIRTPFSAALGRIKSVTSRTKSANESSSSSSVDLPASMAERSSRSLSSSSREFTRFIIRVSINRCLSFRLPTVPSSNTVR